MLIYRLQLIKYVDERIETRNYLFSEKDNAEAKEKELYLDILEPYINNIIPYRLLDLSNIRHVVNNKFEGKPRNFLIHVERFDSEYIENQVTEKTGYF